METILDMVCAEYGSELAKTAKNDETMITKSLGVLQEDGLYAFFLYLASKKYADVKNKAFDFLRDKRVLKNHFPDNGKDVLSVIQDNLSMDLNALLFAKELLERTLVYARYHAKANAGDNKTIKSEGQ